MLVVDRPVVDHAAEFFTGAVDKGLLFVGQLRCRERHQLVPLGHAREQLAIPPDAAGLERLALGIGHRWQHLAVDREQRFREFLAAHVDQVGYDHDAEQDPEQQQPHPGPVAEHGVGRECDTRRDRRCTQINALVGEIDSAADEQQRPEQANSQTGQNEDLLCKVKHVQKNCVLLYRSSSIAARSSRSSVSVASMRSRLKSSIARSCTIS